MAHLPELIRDLALILLVGAFVTILFKRIKQPLVLGYIIAGFFVGPHFGLVPDVVDTANIKTFAELGVIFLLFSLGLEFSFKKLMRVGGAASITAIVEIVFVGSGGYIVGKLLGWSTMDSLFLGGMLASSSTTIILKAFDELGVKTKQFARIVFGALIVEDIVVILLMVLLSTVAVTQQFEGSEILFTILKLAFFMALWFLLGIYLLPTFLNRARRWMDEETLLILSIGLCLGMVLLAVQVGFSAELGAFVMGSLIAETTLAEKVEHITKPVKELFGTVFFVSVGMMINPTAMVEYAFPIFVVTMLTIFGKLIFGGSGALLSGQPLKQSVQVGMSMAQIGEFAFIVATLGLSLGVISEFLFPVAVGVSAITTFTTPYMIKYSEPFYNWLTKVVPQSWQNRIAKYSSTTEKLQADPEWKILMKGYIKTIVINSIMLMAVLLLFQFVINPFLDITRFIKSELMQSVVTILLAVAISSPFLWALVFAQPREYSSREAWRNLEKNRTQLYVIGLIRVIVAVLLIGLFIDQLTTTRFAMLASIPVIVVFIVLFSNQSKWMYQSIEKRFVSNFQEREIAEEKASARENLVKSKRAEIVSSLQAWDAHITELNVPPLAAFVGTPLKDLKWKETYGINVVYIQRGEKILQLPGRDAWLLPYDRVGILATDEQIQHFKPVFDAAAEVVYDDIIIEDIRLEQFLISEGSPLIGQSILSSGIREVTRSSVVGLERDDVRHLNPSSTTVIQEGDILWLVGSHKSIRDYADGLKNQVIAAN